MKHILFTLLALLVTSGAFAQNNETTTTNQYSERVAPSERPPLDPSAELRTTKAKDITNYDDRFPESFPKYIYTGNQEEDVANYQTAIKNWYYEHPEEGKKLLEKGLIKI